MAACVLDHVEENYDGCGLLALHYASWSSDELCFGSIGTTMFFLYAFQKNKIIVINSYD
jgi:hypothetical protein